MTSRWNRLSRVGILPHVCYPRHVPMHAKNRYGFLFIDVLLVTAMIVVIIAGFLVLMGFPSRPLSSIL